MKKILIVVFLLLCYGMALAADSTVSNLTATTSPSTVDLLYIVTDPSGTPASKKVTLGNALAVQDSRTATYTNKTINAESTGNTITIPVKIWLPFAQCNNATAVLLWDSPTSNAAAAACYGSNSVKGVADFDAATDESLHMWFPWPTDWDTLNVDINIYWFAAATSGSVRWGVRIDCYAAGEDHDVASSNTTTFAGTPNATTNRLVRTNSTGLTVTGCAALEMAKIQVFRDADGTGGTDDMSGDARGIGVELTLRRAM